MNTNRSNTDYVATTEREYPNPFLNAMQASAVATGDPNVVMLATAISIWKFVALLSLVTVSEISSTTFAAGAVKYMSVFAVVRAAIFAEDV